ncbi:MAG: hypothetical protein ACLQEQ_09770 [Nitrososphaerales archaeon]
MRKAVAILGLALMAVGLGLTAFGTQQTSAYGMALTCQGHVCQGIMVGAWVEACTGNGICQFSIVPSSTASFTLNYFGFSLAVLGAVFFAAFYPKRPSSFLPANAISLSF